MGVDRARYDLVSPSRLVLVDDRCTLAVVTHPGHQIPETGAADRSEVVPGVPEIVKVQAFGAYCPDSLGPSRCVLSRSSLATVPTVHGIRGLPI